MRYKAKVILKFWSQLTQSLVISLLLIVTINVTWFFLFPKVGRRVGAATGIDAYEEIAANLIKGHGFIFSPGMRSTIELGYMKREPIYPLLLSVILRLTGTLSPAVLGLFQTSLSLISCYLIYRLGERIFGASTAGLACLIYALHPLSFWYSTRSASEIVAVPAMLLCLCLIERFFAEPTRMKAAQVGVSIGIATLAKNACVMLLPVLLLFILLKWHTKLLQFLSCVIIIIFLHVTILSLWLIRNYAISGEIVPFTTNSGGVFFIGNMVVEQFDVQTLTAGEPEAEMAAQALYGVIQDGIAARAPHMSLPRLEAQTDKQLTAMARHLIFANPFFAVRKFLSGMCFIWFLSDTTAKSWGWMLYQMPLVALAVMGLCRERPRDFRQCFLLCVAVAYIVPYTLLLALARYSMPIMPIVIFFASYGLVTLCVGDNESVPDLCIKI
jgi:4-amino-4-deoxy-L-arabinose transferase-like glycosyltransferase